MRPGGGDFERAFALQLSADVVQIGGIRRRHKRSTPGFDAP